LSSGFAAYRDWRKTRQYLRSKVSDKRTKTREVFGMTDFKESDPAPFCESRAGTGD
jgi:hypothetical protein